MPRPVAITPKNLRAHIEAHCKQRGLNTTLSWEVFVALAQGKAGIASMARVFDTSWRTMRDWLRVYETEKK